MMQIGNGARPDIRTFDLEQLHSIWSYLACFSISHLAGDIHIGLWKFSAPPQKNVSFS